MSVAAHIADFQQHVVWKLALDAQGPDILDPDLTMGINGELGDLEGYIAAGEADVGPRTLRRRGRGE